MDDKFDFFTLVVFWAVILTGCVGSYVIGIMVMKNTSVWLGIGVIIVGQLVSGLPNRISSKYEAKLKKNQPSVPAKSEDKAEESIPKDANAEEKKSMMQEAIDKYFD